MIALLIVFVYLVGFVWTFRRQFFHILRREITEYHSLDSDDWFFGILFSSLLALIWPFWVPFLLFKYAPLSRDRMLRIMARIPKEERYALKERELRERERRIRNLERSVGL